MHEFFKPWRRKFGVVTLFMACAITGLWVRSNRLRDTGALPIGNDAIGLQSQDGCLDFFRLISLNQRPTWETDYIESLELPDGAKEYPLHSLPWTPGRGLKWRRDWGDFHIGEGETNSRIEQDCIVPHWSVVIPLTLLSAWLLVSKPRPKSKQRMTNA